LHCSYLVVVLSIISLWLLLLVFSLVLTHLFS